MLVSNIRNSYNPIMKRVEDNFGSNSDMSLTFNTITADSASDVVNLRKQVREAGRLEDETAQKDLADIERKKKQRDELIANKAINNKSVVKSWADAFDIAEDDETIKSLSKEITDLSEKIRADNMWFSTKRSFEE
jgi:polyhydroxyalkanoate synthesis regulator phasin